MCCHPPVICTSVRCHLRSHWIYPRHATASWWQTLGIGRFVNVGCAETTTRMHFPKLQSSSKLAQAKTLSSLPLACSPVKTLHVLQQDGDGRDTTRTSAQCSVSRRASLVNGLKFLTYPAADSNSTGVLTTWSYSETVCSSQIIWATSLVFTAIWKFFMLTRATRRKKHLCKLCDVEKTFHLDIRWTDHVINVWVLHNLRVTNL